MADELSSKPKKETSWVILWNYHAHFQGKFIKWWPYMMMSLSRLGGHWVDDLLSYNIAWFFLSFTMSNDHRADFWECWQAPEHIISKGSLLLKFQRKMTLELSFENFDQYPSQNLQKSARYWICYVKSQQTDFDCCVDQFIREQFVPELLRYECPPRLGPLGHLFDGPRRKDTKLMIVTNISISMENRKSKSVYRADSW